MNTPRRILRVWSLGVPFLVLAAVFSPPAGGDEGVARELELARELVRHGRFDWAEEVCTSVADAANAQERGTLHLVRAEIARARALADGDFPRRIDRLTAACADLRRFVAAEPQHKLAADLRRALADLAFVKVEVALRWKNGEAAGRAVEDLAGVLGGAAEEQPLGAIVQLDRVRALLLRGDRDSARVAAVEALKQSQEGPEAVRAVATVLVIRLAGSDALAPDAVLDEVARLMRAKEFAALLPGAGGELPGVRVVGREVPPGSVRGRTAGARRADDAVTRALTWLARHQDADGSWDADNFAAQCKKSVCLGKGPREHGLGVTGLALLAFLGAGYSHLSRDALPDPVTGQETKFGETVKTGLAWLLKSQGPDGRFLAPTGPKYLYDHALATLALAEAYGLTASPLFKEPAQRAVNFLVQAKNPYRAWRYQPRDGDNDTSVTAWCLLALTSAESAGLAVPRSTLEEALSFIDAVTEKNYGKVGYIRLEDAGVKVVVPGKNEDYANHDSLTAAGMVSRLCVSRNPRDPMLELGAKLLVQDLPLWDKERKTNDYYYWFWGTYALLTYDGPDSGRPSKYWSAWNKFLVEALNKHQAGELGQCACGSWDADDRWGFEGGRVYATALNALTLEGYYRYGNILRGGRPR